MIDLAPAHRPAIATHAQAEHPNECCGLMLGVLDDTGRKIVRELLPIPNERGPDARRNRFLLGPTKMLRGERMPAHAASTSSASITRIRTCRRCRRSSISTMRGRCIRT